MIKVDNISLISKNRQILNNISFKADDEILVIMGPSGAGKSTLLNVISGFIKPTDGDVSIDRVFFSKSKQKMISKLRLKKISYIFQDFCLIDYLNVKQNIVLQAKLSKHKFQKEKFNKIVKDLKLTDKLNARLDQLSGGEKQRVAIARALLNDSPYIIADEPTASLDIISSKHLLAEFKLLAKEHKKTIILITHDPFIAEKGDRVLFLVDGKMHEYDHHLPITSKNIISELVRLEKTII